VILTRLGWMDFGQGMNDSSGAQGGQEAEAGSRLGVKLRRLFYSTSTASIWEEFNSQQQEQDVSGEQFTWGYGWTKSSFPAVVMVLQDIQFLILLAIVLALVRVWMVHMLVPAYLTPKRLEALARSKSSHMLASSSYSFETKQWSKVRKRAEAKRGSDRGNKNDDEDEQRGKRSIYERILTIVSTQWYMLRPSVRRALGHEPSARFNDFVTQQNQDRSFRRSNSTSNPTQHLFNAPRHATASFRLVYTTTSCLLALMLFRDAEFWPRIVFGTHEQAATKHCWDLSGSFSALGFLDEDYDERNGDLKYFFLAQASYHLHSLFFHVCSMTLLILYGGDSNDGRKLISMKTSTQSYIRPLVEHIVVLALLVGAYLFSGLRRLGAVGIFTMDLSSASLQLLQACLYAPENSWLRKPEVVMFVHRVVTVPTFVYCRLLVLPFVLWRSALFESQDWLEQIERVFYEGLGERVYFLFNASLCLLFTLNLVLFRRLIFHPHLRQIRQVKVQ